MLDVIKPATGPAVWTGEEVSNSDDWIIQLTDSEIEELDAALSIVENKKTPIQNITVDEFPLPLLGRRLTAFADELQIGRGFGVIRGLPINNYNEEASKIITWGICTYLGAGIPQSRQGDWINHVIDLSDITSTNNPDLHHIVNRKELRYSHKGGELRWHTDSADIVALFCIKKAKTGGKSRLASSAKVHNLILEKNPECLNALYKGYYYMSLADDNDTETPKVSSERIPVFTRDNNTVNFYYIPQVVDRAIDRAKISYNTTENDARDLIQSAANLPGIAHEFILEPGDLEVINNRKIMHAREEFEDYPDLDKRRHMLRLWLAATPEMATNSLRTPADL